MFASSKGFYASTPVLRIVVNHGGRRMLVTTAVIIFAFQVQEILRAP
jgi:hypothetical protein